MSEGNPNNPELENQDDIKKRLEALEKEKEQLQSTNNRLLEESKKYKSRSKELEDLENEREAEKKKLEEQKMMEVGEYKKLWEQEKEKTKSYEQKFLTAEQEKEQLGKTLVEAKKLQAFQSRLGGKLKNDDYMMFVDTESIAIDPESGSIDMDSVDNSVKSFLESHKSLVDFGNRKMPNFDGFDSKPITQDQFNKMSLADKKKHLSKMVEQHKNKRK